MKTTDRGRRDGLLLIDKPSGPTSHGVVARVRRVLGLRRVGHAGTLDPLATGLLPLVLGRATRLVRFLPRGPKVYEGTLLLGRTTITDDVTGALIREHDGRLPAPDEVLRRAHELEGSGLQLPPAISARKVAGRRLYRVNRNGVRISAAPSIVEVAHFDLVPDEAPGVYRFSVEVSAGTYVRSLVRDLGAALDCGGVLASLRRTAIGPLRLDAAFPLDAEQLPDEEELARWVLPLERMRLVPPVVRLANETDLERFRRGALLARPGGSADGVCQVLAPDGRLLGIAECGASGLHPRVVLPADS